MVTTQVHGLLEESASDNGLFVEVERILQSDTLRNSDVSRRLLKFLAEKTLSGEADQLKEYTIAIEALDRPQAYDPKHDSTVRSQMGRLRQKLAEYYRTEGKDDPVIIDLPTRHFKLTYFCRPAIAESFSAPIAESVSAPGITESTSAHGRIRPASRFIWLAGLVCVSLMIATGWIVHSLDHKSTEVPKLADEGAWNADLDQLWRPFLSSNRPLILAVGDPPFIRLQPSGLFLHGPSFLEQVNSEGPADAKVDKLVSAIQKLQGDTSLEESHYYVPFGEMGAAFLIGRALGHRVRDVSLIKKSELSMQQFANNNIVFLTKDYRTQAQYQGMPIRLQLQPSANGIQNLDPRPGEPKEFSNNAGIDADSGDSYALVSQLPGPLGNGEVEVFTSRNSFAYLGAVQWYTNPAFAHTLVSKLRKSNGELPRYYQVLLRVRFKDQVPFETTFVLSRELQ